MAKANHDFKCPGEETVKCQICPQATFCTILTGDSECIFCGKKPCICAVIELPKLPEPGTQSWENMVDFIRADMANVDRYSKLIKAAKKSIEARGLNFNEEFEKWKKNREVR